MLGGSGSREAHPSSLACGAGISAGSVPSRLQCVAGLAGTCYPGTLHSLQPGGDTGGGLWGVGVQEQSLPPGLQLEACWFIPPARPLPEQSRRLGRRPAAACVSSVFVF